ncbi:DNA-binding response regulator [Bifidobacterium lemurum]|uniref:DNA-binding response regulator n=1 Tax=Bifidobacterium lemurum TaxID=1603886 RepID=A0A261FPR6_9BIFI|nr:LytTR family DNA-binding domain-containing protein [Bifidobacterium lemurum]OZG60985.1 DNA-binding response regulator [Bifidobacterium lemurum]QOL34778.1 response regulator transcription factor [Bifidobacterium lemurum]
MFNVAIVDDDAADARWLRACAERWAKESGEDVVCTVFESALAFLNVRHSPFDIVFMDIEMPHLDGMEAARRMRELDSRTCLIFVTSMAQYAIKGYEVDAMDFVVKPVSYPQFRFKMDKAVAYARKMRRREFVLQSKNGLIRLPESDIQYVEVFQHRLRYHTTRGVLEGWGTLSQTEQRLEAGRFARCHASYLVNLMHVNEVRGDVVVVSGDELPLTRRKKKEFMDALVRFIGS